MTIETTELALGSTRALAISPSGGSRTGVLLYPTIMGVNEPMRRFAGELADLGMAVVIWDPYRGDPVQGSIIEIVEKSKRCHDDDAIHDVTRIADHMGQALGVDRIGGIGWCFGGRIGILHAALDKRVEVFCSYNPTMLSVAPVEIEGVGTVSKADQPGQTMDEMALAAQIVGPVQVTRPSHDFTQPAEYEALTAALFQRPDPTFYEFYPGTDHGFSYMPGAANAHAHRLAWARTLDLLTGLHDRT